MYACGSPLSSLLRSVFFVFTPQRKPTHICDTQRAPPRTQPEAPVRGRRSAVGTELLHSIEQLISEVSRRNRPLLHELQVEPLGREALTELLLDLLPQLLDLLLAQPIGNRLRGPAGIAGHGGDGGSAAGALGIELQGLAVLTRAGQ